MTSHDTVLCQVRTREASYNNAGFIARSAVLSFGMRYDAMRCDAMRDDSVAGKLMYYRLFAAAYGTVGRFASVVLVNSSWTRHHIDALVTGCDVT